MRAHTFRMPSMLVCIALAMLAAGGPALAAREPAFRAPRAEQWEGQVTRVTDGDTLWVRPSKGGKPRKIRILGIDAPEICQLHGREARAALERLVRGHAVQVQVLRTDDYGRPLAYLRNGPVDLARSLVLQGHAWSYRFRRDDGPYAPEEAQARQKRLGLFADDEPERPYDFRRRHGSCYS